MPMDVVFCDSFKHKSFLRVTSPPASFFFFFNDTATTEIYTLSLHDALPISGRTRFDRRTARHDRARGWLACGNHSGTESRSEEHTSELQSHSDLVCRLLLEKKKTTPLRLHGLSPDCRNIAITHTRLRSRPSD